MADTHNGEHAVAPDKTTVQWSPGAGVEHGHEGTDANLRSTIQWFAATAVFMILSIVVLWWVYDVWSGYETRSDLLPSKLYGIRQVPPEPRILPNPADTELHPEQLVRGPAELLADHRRAEDAELQQYGLEDATTGSPRLPAGAVDTVVAGNRAARARIGGAAPAPPGASPALPASTTGTIEPMPSYASGGTVLENYLQ